MFVSTQYWAERFLDTYSVSHANLFKREEDFTNQSLKAGVLISCEISWRGLLSLWLFDKRQMMKSMMWWEENTAGVMISKQGKIAMSVIIFYWSLKGLQLRLGGLMDLTSPSLQYTYLNRVRVSALKTPDLLSQSLTSSEIPLITSFIRTESSFKNSFRDSNKLQNLAFFRGLNPNALIINFSLTLSTLNLFFSLLILTVKFSLFRPISPNSIDIIITQPSSLTFRCSSTLINTLIIVLCRIYQYSLKYILVLFGIPYLRFSLSFSIDALSARGNKAPWLRLRLRSFISFLIEILGVLLPLGVQVKSVMGWQQCFFYCSIFRELDTIQEFLQCFFSVKLCFGVVSEGLGLKTSLKRWVYVLSKCLRCEGLRQMSGERDL